MNSILLRIDELRKAKGWSKFYLSKAMGVSANTVYGWYQSGAVPSQKTIKLICDAMDITEQQFFCGTGEFASLSDDEQSLLKDWITLTDLEKSSIFNMIEVFKILKQRG